MKVRIPCDDAEGAELLRLLGEHIFQGGLFDMVSEHGKTYMQCYVFNAERAADPDLILAMLHDYGIDDEEFLDMRYTPEEDFL